MKTGTFAVVSGSPVTPSTIPSSEAWLFSFLSFLNFEAFGLISGWIPHLLASRDHPLEQRSESEINSET